jgi:hypothetical protein
MINITFKVEGIDGLLRKLDIARKQIPFATALALTKTAQQAQQDVTAELPRIFDRPNPFTQRAIGYTRASKVDLTAKVFIRAKQAAYLQRQITGGTRLPRGKGLALPANAPIDQFGNVRRAWLRQVKNRKDVFSGTVGGVPGLWQRTGKGGARGLKLLLAYEPRAEYTPRFDFAGLVKQSVQRHLQRNVRDAVAQAMRTAR